MSTKPSAVMDEVRAPDETLESVRELLFGRQVRHFEQQLAEQNSNAARRLEGAQTEIQQRVADMEAHCAQQFSVLTNRIAQLEQQLAKQNQAMHETKAGRSDLAELFSELAGRLDEPSGISDSVALN